jgi:hypothetical protein
MQLWEAALGQIALVNAGGVVGGVGLILVLAGAFSPSGNGFWPMVFSAELLLLLGLIVLDERTGNYKFSELGDAAQKQPWLSDGRAESLSIRRFLTSMRFVETIHRETLQFGIKMKLKKKELVSNLKKDKGPGSLG